MLQLTKKANPSRMDGCTVIKEKLCVFKCFICILNNLFLISYNYSQLSFKTTLLSFFAKQYKYLNYKISIRILSNYGSKNNVILFNR